MEVSNQIEGFRNFFEKLYLSDILTAFQNGRSVIVVDFIQLSKFNIELAEELLDNPDELIKAAEIAIESFDIPESIKTFHVRFDNLSKDCEYPINELRETHLDKFIAIKGLIRQKTKVLPQATSTKFECPACGNTITILQLDSKYKEPGSCSCGRKGKFRHLNDVLCSMQAMVIEEDPEFIEASQQPQRLNVILKDDLTNKFTDKKTIPGGKILINGILKKVPIMLRDGGYSTRFDLLLEANFIKPIEDEIFNFKITEEKIKKFREFSERKDLFEHLKKHIAPTVHGYSDVKESLVLMLVGGVSKELQKNTPRKDQIHILLIGEPGTGKTMMGRSILNLIPRARYISGKGASGAGVTAAVVKNDITKDWGLEAGAMVLANGSVLISDEQEKMEEQDVTQMHTGMETGKIHIDKANIHATLTAKTTILGIANPKFGRFDPYEPIGKQINLPASLLSRYDLMWVIKDVPDEKKDRELAKFILNLHMNREDTLELKEEDYVFFREYISFSRTIRPVLTEESNEIILSFFISMRKTGSNEENRRVSLGTRQLEGLIRLTEASAKIRLSDKTNKEDAERAIKLMLGFLKEFGYDSKTNVFDIDRVQSDTPASERSKIHTIRSLIKKMSLEFVDKKVPIDALVEEAKKEKIDNNDVDELIEKLKNAREIFEPRSGFLQEM